MAFSTNAKPALRPWRELSLPPAVTGIRSMLSDEEKQYLTWLTSVAFEGWGAVIDLGPWLGSSSAALAEGLVRRGSSKKVYSFDLFRWENSYMEPVAQTNLQDGDDFLPVFQHEIGQYAPWIDARKEDLMQYAWEGGDIEILFVDAAKSWALTNAIFKGFAHRLVPGKSRVIMQDFRYPETHWLPLIFDSRPDLWKEVESVSEGYTVTFMPAKPLNGPAGIHTDYSEEAFPIEPAERLLRERMAVEEASNRIMILGALYRKYLLDGPLHASGEIREELIAGGVQASLLAIIEDSALVSRAWKAYDKGDYASSLAIADHCLSLPNNTSVYALEVRAFSFLRLGRMEEARLAMEQTLLRAPGAASTRLLRAEFAIREGRADDAAAEAFDVLKRNQGSEVIIDYALSVLTQAWRLQGGEESHANSLAEVAGIFSQSPTFLTFLAREQFNAGLIKEAAQSLEKALALAPAHQRAITLRSEWEARDTARSEVRVSNPQHA